MKNINQKIKKIKKIRWLLFWSTQCYIKRNYCSSLYLLVNFFQNTRTNLQLINLPKSQNEVAHLSIN